MILYDPIGTIIRVSLACMVAGMLAAAVAVAIIHTGSTQIRPRIPAAQIWSRWREKRMVWGLGLCLPLLAIVLLSEIVTRTLGLADIYWMAREGAILWIGRLATTCGYLLVLLAVVITGLIRRRRTTRIGKNTSDTEA